MKKKKKKKKTTKDLSLNLKYCSKIVSPFFHHPPPLKNNYSLHVFSEITTMKIVFCDSLSPGGTFTPYNHHLMKITSDLTLQPGDIALCVLQNQPNSPVYQQVILNHESFTLYPTGRFKATLTIFNNTNKTLFIYKNNTLNTITAINNVRFSFGFISNYDLQQYIFHIIQNC
jgi:hypothetical protein